MMKFYRNTYYSDSQGHAGFSWHETYEEAEAAFAGVGEKQGTLAKMGEEFYLPSTKRAMRSFLNLHAAHPDNG